MKNSFDFFLYFEQKGKLINKSAHKHLKSYEKFTASLWRELRKKKQPSLQFSEVDNPHNKGHQIRIEQDKKLKKKKFTETPQRNEQIEFLKLGLTGQQNEPLWTNGDSMNKWNR